LFFEFIRLHSDFFDTCFSFSKAEINRLNSTIFEFSRLNLTFIEFSLSSQIFSTPFIFA